MAASRNRPKAYVVSNSADFQDCAADLLTDLGIEALAIADLSGTGRPAGADGALGVLAIVDLDALGDLEEATEKLLVQRVNTPGIPTVLASRNFRRDDYGPERISIADVSVRFPFGRNGLAAAISQALVNNSGWISACQTAPVARIA